MDLNTKPYKVVTTRYERRPYVRETHDIVFRNTIVVGDCGTYQLTQQLVDTLNAAFHAGAVEGLKHAHEMIQERVKEGY